MGKTSKNLQYVHPYKVAQMEIDEANGKSYTWETAIIKRRIFRNSTKPDEIISVTKVSV
jgi:hypothetical protein